MTTPIEDTSESAQRAARSSNAVTRLAPAGAVDAACLTLEPDAGPADGTPRLECVTLLDGVEDAIAYMKRHDFDGDFDIVITRRIRVKVKKSVSAEYV